MKRFLTFFALALLLAGPLAAQDLTSLVADRVSVDPAGRITAEGNVEVWSSGVRLTAERVTYSRAGDRLTIDGPIFVEGPDGTVFQASEATLDPELRTGILRSARLVLDRQLQLAAAEIARTGDRYVRLDRVVASSCQVCPDNPTPLWEIRARRVIHDRQERLLYFEGAQVRVAGLPILYAPRLRLPDPTLDRATGLLIPRFSTSSRLGTGVKLPYFIRMGRHADLTLTPYLTARTTTVELRFRQALRRGAIVALGALTQDDLEDGRGYLFADASYRLPRDFLAELRLELVSDPSYLSVYGYSDKDRLANRLSVSRVRDKDRFRAAVTEFRTLREAEIPIRDRLTDRYAEVFYEREIRDRFFGGRTFVEVSASALNRPSSEDVFGRDTSRVGAALRWRRDGVFGPGLVAALEAGLRVDTYNIGQDSSFDQFLTRIVPRAAVELRWPLSRSLPGGATEVLQPILRLDIADTGGDRVPLEDSRIVEFDEGNLFSSSRYPGIDGVENGTRIAVGATWHRVDPAGWEGMLAVGRLARLDGDLGFAEGTGLAGDRSQWLAAGQLRTGSLWLVTRSLFDDDFGFTLSETRVDWANDWATVGTSFLYARPEPAEGRTERLSEWAFDGSVALTEDWTARAGWRYDLTAGQAARAALGVGYRNECIDVDLSVSRRYLAGITETPTTELGVRVSLTGFGEDEDSRRRARRVCRG